MQANFSIGQREDIQTSFIASQPQEVQADLSINVTPSKLSQLENDVPYLTSTDIESITEDITELQGDVTNLGNNKQDTLISGENIKTINDTSILGSGNIEIDLSDYATTQELTNGLATKQNVLTAGSNIELYQKVDYVQNNSNTKVSTGVYITNDNCELDIVFYCKSKESLYLFQTRTSINSNIFGISGSQSGGTIAISMNGYSVTSDIARTIGHIYHVNAKFVSGNATLFVEDLTEQTSATNTGTYTYGVPNKDLTIFGSSVSGQTLSAGYQIYSAYAKQDGEYLLNYVPVVYNNEPCFYNTISNSFKGATAGSLVAGNNDGNIIAVTGLQKQITNTNKLDADLVDDDTSTNKFVTSAQKTQIGTNANDITTINNTISGYGDIVTHNVSEFATSSQGAKADTALQSTNVDTTLSTTSTNPIANSTVTNTLNNRILNFYGTCSTTASTSKKIVTCSDTNFTLTEGVSIRVNFTNANSANAPKLNVNSTGDIGVMIKGTSTAGKYSWFAGEIVSFTYNGTNWIMEDGALATTTYYGYTKLGAGATSTSSDLALVPSSLNAVCRDMIAGCDVYSATSAYAVGDRIRRDYNILECNTAIPEGGETFDATHWTVLPSIQEQIDSLQAQINALQ